MKSFDIQAEKQLKEKAVLVGVLRREEKSLYSKPLTELANLAKTAGVEIVGKLSQQRSHIHPGTYIGKGKLQELKTMAEEQEATLIICDHDLSPGQARNLEKMLEIRVLDRTELILDIFAMSAQTREAKLQVEMAQMQYILPRLRRMWTHLEGSQGGVGFRGPGEKQLETDRQIIKKRIADCKKKLEEIQGRKKREVESRNKRFFTVGLVGYTNAGKSSLLNALTDAGVLAADKLFATLDTKTKMWEIEHNRKVMLSDTVGFINELPHRLIASFRATLEEASSANMLLHVVDASHPDVEHQIKVVEKVLTELQLNKCPLLLVFNKIDVIDDSVDFSYIKSMFPNHICISAKTGKNLDLLAQKVLESMEAGMAEVELELPAGAGKLLAEIEQCGRIIKKEYLGAVVSLQVYLPQENISRLQKYVKVNIA